MYAGENEENSLSKDFGYVSFAAYWYIIYVICHLFPLANIFLSLPYTDQNLKSICSYAWMIPRRSGGWQKRRKMSWSLQTAKTYYLTPSQEDMHICIMLENSGTFQIFFLIPYDSLILRFLNTARRFS